MKTQFWVKPELHSSPTSTIQKEEENNIKRTKICVVAQKETQRI